MSLLDFLGPHGGLAERMFNEKRGGNFVDSFMKGYDRALSSERDSNFRSLLVNKPKRQEIKNENLLSDLQRSVDEWLSDVDI